MGIIQILIKDPANPGRDGWRNINDGGGAVSSLAGNIKKIFLTDIKISEVKTTDARQPDGWSCGPYALAEALGHANGEAERAFLLRNGMISSAYGTDHYGIGACLKAFEHNLTQRGQTLWQSWFNGQCGYVAGFQELVSHLENGYKAILLMGGLGTGAGGRCRNSYWSNAGHYICAYGVQGGKKDIKEKDQNTTDSAKPSSNNQSTQKVHTFELSDITSTSAKHSDVLFLQKILKVKGYYKGELNGQYNSQTINAVKDYQKAQKITVDGKVTYNVWKKLLGNIVQ